MPIFTENGISVQFASNWFQFAHCNEYTKISNNGVKEMDFGWIDTQNNTLWLIELKGFINPNPHNDKFQETDISKSNIVEKKIKELLLKSIHSVCMIDNRRSDTIQCIPAVYNSNLKIKLIHVLNIKRDHIPHLIGMNAKLNTEFKAYKAIFNITSINIVDYETAKNMYSFVI